MSFKTCRTCLATDCLKPLFEITLSGRQEMPFSVFLEKISDLEIKPDDGFSDKVCEKCVIKTADAFYYRELLIWANEKFYYDSNSATIPETHDELQNGLVSNENIVKSETNCVELIEDDQEASYDNNEQLFDTIKEEINQTNENLETLEEKPIKFLCTTCNEVFINDIVLKSHLESHRISLKWKCTQCSKTFDKKSELKAHMRIHKLAHNLLICGTCGKYCNNKYQRKVHEKRVHIAERNFQCEFCSKRFKSKQELQMHIRTHSNERPYVCDICGNGFKQSTDLKTHKYLHSGERPFLCSICGNRFLTTGSLNVHLRTHTKDRPFKCVMCSKAFITRTILRKHMRTHTDERPYKCKHCSQAFRQSNTLKQHQVRHERKLLREENEQEQEFIENTPF